MNGQQDTASACEHANPIYTTADLARLFRVSPKTIGRWVAEGRIPQPLRISRRKRWMASAFQQYLDGLQEA
jgi:predicted DNA-binding transcriptional regulator AlpA